MDKYKSRRGATDRFSKALGEADRGLSLATLVHEWSIDEPVAAIQQDDSELLLR
jgi:hypothetical protein